MERKCGIYKIENKINHKVYIGQSTNIIQRWQTHKSELNNNYHHNDYLQKAWNKYGKDNFSFEIIELCDKDNLNNLERYYIDQYKSFNHDYGYNMTDGGDASMMVIDGESLERKRKKLSGKNSHMAKSVICLETNQIYDTIVEAARTYGVTSSNISRACSGAGHGSSGYHWLFYEDYLKKSDKEIEDILSDETLLNHQKPIICLNTYETWTSIQEAGKRYNICPQSIGACCNNKRKSAGKTPNGEKMVFMYLKDYLKNGAREELV